MSISDDTEHKHQRRYLIFTTVEYSLDISHLIQEDTTAHLKNNVNRVCSRASASSTDCTVMILGKMTKTYVPCERRC